MEGIEIRPLADGEVEFITSEMNKGWPYGRPLGLHLERLAMQQQGEAVYLSAWRGARPLGHAYLRWQTSEGDLPHAKEGPCAYLSDLFVIPECWSQGIGTQFMDKCESLALGRGYTQIELRVAEDNERALSIYNRRGYRDLGYERRQSRWSYLHPDGTEGIREEVYVLMVKPLQEA
jgi:GNAT superfamily N-acetyltransferase